MSKPAYRVPSMGEIAALPWNGFNVVSTFSGCGGSCLGYRMAGFKVLWASEFIPLAQECYRLNHPGSILDTRDIRKVQAEDILKATGLAKGQLDILDGSPPCASFSTSGKREAGWGKVKAYSDTRQRTDDLFFEYARLVRDLQPRTFVAENVSGLVKGTAKGYFLEILRTLKACGYQVDARLLDAQWLGVPQMRQRLIFMGVRNDLATSTIRPAYPSPLTYRYSVREALADLFATPVVAPRDNRGSFGKEGEISTDPAPTILAETAGNLWIEEQCGFNGHRYLSADRPMGTVGDDRPVRVMEIESRNGQFISADAVARTVRASDGGRSSTTLENDTGHVKDSAGTVRKFTIAELRRICAFPDDFALVGSYAQQWERLGRAVPPVMMSHIAAAVRDGVLCKLPR